MIQQDKTWKDQPMMFNYKKNFVSNVKIWAQRIDILRPKYTDDDDDDDDV